MKAGETLTAKVSGKIKLGKRSFALKPLTKPVASGKSLKLALTPKRRADKNKISAALKTGKKAKATVSVKLSDAHGNTVTRTVRVTLKS